MKKFLSFITALCLYSTILNAQLIKNIGNLPFVNNYKSEDYNGGRQNFDIIEDNRGLIFVANSDEAVLVFDGANWERIPIPNTVVFSLAQAYDNRIYVGAKNDIGYLELTDVKGFQFKSLLNLIPEIYRNFGQVWQIVVRKDSTIIFLSGMNLFMYKNDSIKVLNIDSIITDAQSLFLRVFKIYDEIYVSLKYKGIYRLVGDSLYKVPGSEQLWDVMAMLPYPGKQILVVTFFNGFYLYDFQIFRKIQTQLDEILNQNIYRAIDIRHKYYAFLMVDGGILITDYTLSPVQKLDVSTGLYNDKAQRATVDHEGNLWLALDNGIASVYLFSPFTVFDKNYGFNKSTKIFSSQLLNDTLYIASSEGLKWRQWYLFEDKTLPYVKFERVKDIPHKTYLLKAIDNCVFGSSDIGLYQVCGLNAKYLLSDRAIRSFIHLNSNPNIIIGAQNALTLFKKVDGKWKFVRPIANFKLPLYLVVEADSNLLFGSEATAGVYKIYLSPEYDSVVKIEIYNEQNGLHGLPSQYKNYVFKIDNQVVVATVDGIYGYDFDKDEFYPLEKINKVLTQKGAINLIYQDSYGNIWLKQEVTRGERKHWELVWLKKNDTGYTEIRNIFYPFRNKIFSFSQIDKNTYIIGSEGGFIHFDLRYLQDFGKTKFRAFIRSVKLINTDSVIFAGYAQSETNRRLVPEIKHKFNDIRIVYSANYYINPKSLQYSYYLKGYDDGWSTWSSENVKEYSNLPPGFYTFYVKAKNDLEVESQPDSFSFVILPPWYKTIWAYIGYVIAAGLLVWLIVYLYTLRLRRQKEYLEELVRQRTYEIERQKEEIEKQRDLLAKQNEEIRRKNKDITDSIEYAKRIQTAMLPLEETISKYLPEHFILYKPRDIVSGDFYWFAYKDGKIIIAAVDCTGHGVPGAFMSMIGAEVLNTIVLINGVTDPAEILTLQNKYIRAALKQDTTENQDGMDMALCVIDKENGILEFAGAKNPLIYIDKEHKLHKIRGDRQSIGGYQYMPVVKFKKHTIKIESPMWFYIFSDGYQDQFGGKEHRKFMAKFFYELLHKIHTLPMQEQKRILEQTLEQWRLEGGRVDENGNIIPEPQTDDILVIGFKL